MDIYAKRIKPILVDKSGNVTTFEEAKIDYNNYLVENRKLGYYKQPLMLIYQILPEDIANKPKPEGYVFPVNGFGLWDAIYGYLAIKTGWQYCHRHFLV